MSSPEKRPSEASRKGRLPFEPANKNRNKSAKTTPAPLAATQNKGESPRQTPSAMGIPPAVSKRMALRMATFCGLPTALGMLSFIASYVAVSHDWFKLPNIAVVLVSMGFFGLGVLGLSYGLLSASWDEEIAGSKLGWNEFTINWGRMTSAWRENAQLKAED